jgi:hypothetical protein
MGSRLRCPANLLPIAASTSSTKESSPHGAARRFQPHRHPRLQCGGGHDRVGAHQEGVQIVVADHARCAPDGKLSARDDFGDAGLDAITAAGRQQLDRRADAQTVELVFPQVEGGPA